MQYTGQDMEAEPNNYRHEQLKREKSAFISSKIFMSAVFITAIIILYIRSPKPDKSYYPFRRA